MNRRQLRRHLVATYISVQWDGESDIYGGSITQLCVHGRNYRRRSNTRNALYDRMFDAGVIGARIGYGGSLSRVLADACKAFADEFRSYDRFGTFQAAIPPEAMRSAQAWGPRFTELARMIAAEADGADHDRCERIDALLAAYAELDQAATP